MANYRFTNAAVEDLSEIWNYTISEWSIDQAEKYYNQLIDFCKEAANDPAKGKCYDLIFSGLLGVKANRHIIFYRIVSERTIEIVRILHERMDLKDRILE